jgi:hypothetical protein
VDFYKTDAADAGLFAVAVTPIDLDPARYLERGSGYAY